MKKVFSLMVTTVALSLFAVSCGKQPQVLKDIQVQTTTVDQDLYVSLSAEMDLGNMTFPAASIPIRHPKGQTLIGNVEMVPVLGGKNLLKVSVNVSELSGLDTANVQLPNGNTVPLIANNAAVAVKLPNGAQLYLALGQRVAAIGVAIPIAPFDAIGQALPGLNLFPVLNIDKIVATAGIFTGRAGQNGIALVADISNAVFPQTDTNAQRAMGIMAMSSSLQIDERETIKLDYSSQAPSKSKKDALDQMIYKLNQKKTRLDLHR